MASAAAATERAPSEPAAAITSILIADDHPVMRSSLRMLLALEGDLEVVGEAGSVSETLEQLQALEPDVLLLDLYMPGGPSLGLIPVMRETSPTTRIVVLTMQLSPGFAREALRLGASGYVTKQAADVELVRAIHGVAHGQQYVQVAIGAAIGAAIAAAPRRLADLSERETEVLELIALGHTNSEIARQLGRSVRTVESHRSHLQSKLKLVTRAELVQYALEHGLVARSYR